MVGLQTVNRGDKLHAMQNMVPLSDLTGIAVEKAIACTLCQKRFTSEAAKADHLEQVHPNWAATMMLAYLQQIPRENG